MAARAEGLRHDNLAASVAESLALDVADYAIDPEVRFAARAEALLAAPLHSASHVNAEAAAAAAHQGSGSRGASPSGGRSARIRATHQLWRS